MKADHLYVIGDGGSAVKIGRAADPAGRLSSLQVGSPRPLLLLHVFPEAGGMEREVHGRFAGFHVHREWFDFRDGDPVTAICDAVADIRSRRRQPAPISAEWQEELRKAAGAWGGERRALLAERGPLVQRALAMGISKEEIHMSMGIARTTIDRIQAAAKEGREA